MIYISVPAHDVTDSSCEGLWGAYRISWARMHALWDAESCRMTHVQAQDILWRCTVQQRTYQLLRIPSDMREATQCPDVDAALPHLTLSKVVWLEAAMHTA